MQHRAPVGQVGDALGLNRVLVHRVAATAADAQILGSLQKGRGDGKRFIFGRRRLMTSAADTVRYRESAFRSAAGTGQRLESDVDEAAVAGALSARVGVHMSNGRVGLDNTYELLHGKIHKREGSILRPLNAADQRPCVLLGEEAFRNPDDHHHVQGNGKSKDDEGKHGVIHHPGERNPVDGNQAVEQAFAGAIEPVMALALRMHFEQMRAHGRRGGQRDDHRDDDGR